MIPTLQITTDDVTGMGRYSVGNSTLMPATVDTAELGYDWHFTEGAGVLGISFFRKKLKDSITFSSLYGRDLILAQVPELAPVLLAGEASTGVPLDQLFFPVNQSNQETIKGIELDFSIPMLLPNLNLTANISYTDRDFNIEDVPNDDSLAGNLTLDHLIEPLGITYGVGYNYRESERRVSASGPYVSVITTDREPFIDVFIEKRFSKRFVLRLSGENVTDGASTFQLRDTFDGEQEFLLIIPDQSDPIYSLTLRGSF
jgi:outer membrane receptor protein involved in Fe transport